MKKIFADVFRFIGSVAFISSLTVFAAVAPFSCKVTDDVGDGTPSDSTPPSLVSFSVLDERSVKFEFSEGVSLGNVSVSDSSGGAFAVDGSSISFSEDKSSAEIAFVNGTEVGKDYVLRAVVSDFSGNSLELEQSFSGFNSKKARLAMSELRLKQSANSKEPLKSKVEFVEFCVLNGGNLFGQRVDFGYYSKSYEFPAVEVAAGERVVLHLRKYGTAADGFVDELGSDLSESTAQDSSSARDLWMANTSSVITQNDVVALVDCYSGLAVDGIMAATAGKESWSRKNQSALASLLVSSSVWASDSTSSAVVSDSASYARTLSRQNMAAVSEKFSMNPDVPVPVSADDWIVASEATPGTENSTVAYSK